MASSTIVSRLVILSTILNSFLSRTCSAYTCYFHDGGVADSYVACPPNGDGSCCLESDFCTPLGYCLSESKGYHYRGACTDSTWFNPSCSDYCLANSNCKSATDSLAHSFYQGIVISMLTSIFSATARNSSSVNGIAFNAAQNEGSWCCAYDGNCCSSSTFVQFGIEIVLYNKGISQGLLAAQHVEAIVASELIEGIAQHKNYFYCCSYAS